MSLHNQVAVVTGGSRGIGRAAALELAAQGARVLVNYQHSAAADARIFGVITVIGHIRTVIVIRFRMRWISAALFISGCINQTALG